MKEYPLHRDDKEFVRNERITLMALSIFSVLTKVEVSKRKELIKKYNLLVGKLKRKEH